MCGIAGFYNLKSDNRANIDKMLAKMHHRGPDGSDIWSDGTAGGVMLGHVRLSIIDLTPTGTQPMVSHSGRYVITYNGEIYNASYLYEKMRSQGYTDTMRGTSDTEILLEACAFLGVKETLEISRGMFAFALYDTEDRTLTLARDRIGEKPLFYGITGGAFVFASELGAIRETDGFEARINRRILPLYLKYGYVPAPYSIYENIYKLDPGTILKVKCEFDKYTQPETEKYWDITDVINTAQTHPFDGSRQEAADELDRLLRRSVSGQMISDVPLGAFLSAGIDSSTVVSVMQAVSAGSVRTFTIGFEEADYDESADAARIAAHLGTDHTRLIATPQDARDAIPLMPGIFGEPFGDSSQIPTYLVSKLTREHVTVALSGDGGDELFGGYRDYAGVYSIYNKIRHIPHGLRKTAGTAMHMMPGTSDRARRLRAHGVLLQAHDAPDLYRRTYETWDGLRQLTAGAVADELTERDCHLPEDYCRRFADDPVHAAMMSDMLMYHPDDILTKVDRTAMAVSLETRVPMLDADVVSFAWSLPLEYSFDGTIGKRILRDVLYRYVDPSLMDRPKKGFGVPVARWIKTGDLREWAEHLLSPDLIKRQSLLSAEAVTGLWRDYIDRGIWREQIWYILMLNAWGET